MDSRLTTPQLAEAAVLPEECPRLCNRRSRGDRGFSQPSGAPRMASAARAEAGYPLVTWLLHPGRTVSLDGVDAIEAFFYVMTGITGLVGGLTLGYALLWRYFSERLPAEASPIPRSMVSSISTVKICCVLTIFALAFLLRIHGITRGLSFDEITTAMYFVDANSLLQIISKTTSLIITLQTPPSYTFHRHCLAGRNGP
jgi:hypothetical protein